MQKYNIYFILSHNSTCFSFFYQNEHRHGMEQPWKQGEHEAQFFFFQPQSQALQGFLQESFRKIKRHL
jgi:hypothetical protein